MKQRMKEEAERRALQLQQQQQGGHPPTNDILATIDPLAQPNAAPRAPRDYFDMEPEPIGKGSFSVVHRGTMRHSQESVAIKVISKEHMAGNFAMLRSEVTLLRRIQHPFIVRLIDIFEDHLSIYLVMELMYGGELYRRITNTFPMGFAETNAVYITYRLVSALHYLHENHIVHRDLKPENLIFVTPHSDTDIKLSDFGLAKLLSETAQFTKTACGSPSYVAPEVLSRLPQGYSYAVDMWSAGVITYVLLCGFPPFHDNHLPTLFQLIQRGEYHFAPAAYWDRVTPDAKDFVSKLLLLDATQRMTAGMALEHPWLAPLHAELGPVVQQQIQRFAAAQRASGSAASPPPPATMDGPPPGQAPPAAATPQAA